MAKIDLDAIEPNSNTYKEKLNRLEQSSLDNKNEEREKRKAIISNSQIERKEKHPVKDFFCGFIHSDSDNVKDFLLNDVIIPGFLDILSLCLTGDAGRHGSRGNIRYKDDRDDYTSYYRGRKNKRRSSERIEYTRSRNKLDYQDIVIREDKNSQYTAKESALMIMRDLHDYIERDGHCSIADLFDLVNEPSDFTDSRWGWRMKSSIGVKRVSNGWLIDVDDAVYIGDDD